MDSEQNGTSATPWTKIEPTYSALPPNKVGRAERVNLLNRARCLLAKLVAREVENLETVLGILLIERFQFFVLWCESASGSGVHNQQHLALVVRERNLLSYVILYLDYS